MDIEPASSLRRRMRRGASSMMIALGVILLVTALGVTSMTLASLDNRNSGSTLDIKSAEEAALAGMREVLGRMESNPATTIAQLQVYVSELDKTPKHEWFVPSGSTIALSTTEPAPVPIGGTSNSWTARLLGVDVGGAHGTTADVGIKLAIEVLGYGTDGATRRMIGTYRMRGIDVSVVQVTPTNSDQYALYVNGTMGNSTIAIDIKGDVYVSGDVFLDAGSGNTLVIDSSLRAAGNFKPLSLVQVKGASYIGGCIDMGAHGQVTFGSHLGVAGGYCSISSPVTVGGSFNLYGTNANGSNWTSLLAVGGEQFYVRDQTWSIKAKTTTAGSAFFAKSLTVPGDGLAVGQDLFTWGTQAASFGGPTTVGGYASLRNTGGTSSSGTMSIQGAGYVASPLTVGAAWWNGGPIFLAGGLAGLSSTLTTNDSIRIDATGQKSFGNGNLVNATTGALVMNGSVDANFGKNSNERWNAKTWSYENATSIATSANPRVNLSTPYADPAAAYPTGPWRATGNKLNVLSSIAPARTPKALADPAVPNLGYAVHDTMVALKDNMPNEFYLSKTLQDAMLNLSAVWASAGLPAPSTATYDISDAQYNILFDYYHDHGLLYNGYMVMRLDKDVKMHCSNPIVPFHVKSLLVVDTKVSADPTKSTESWAPSLSAANIQVLYVRGSGEILDFGIPQYSPYDFYGYIYYENNFKGNHSWFKDTKMHGSIYMAGADANIIGSNKSQLTLIYDPDVVNDIQSNLKLIWAYGTKPADSTQETSSRVLTLRETWVQFDLISLTR